MFYKKVLVYNKKEVNYMGGQVDLNVANSWWMYLLGAIVVIFVLAGSIFFIFRAFKEARKMNLDKSVLKKVIFNSAIFTILPSISILIGVITLSGKLGVPLPWIRLTVIGALHYEGAAVEAANDAFNSLGIVADGNVVFVTTAFVMTIGILVGPLFCLFGFKAYDKKILSKTREEDENNIEKDYEPIANVNEPKKEKKNFGQVLFNAVFIAMVCSFLAVDIVKIFKIGQIDEIGNVLAPIDTYVPTIVILVTFVSMFIFDILEKKCRQKWLSSFSLGLSMLIGMIVAILIG